MAAIQILGFCEINQIFVIRIDFDGMGSICEVYFPFLNGYNNSYQFFVVNEVISFYFLKLLEEKSDRIKSFFFISLF